MQFIGRLWRVGRLRRVGRVLGWLSAAEALASLVKMPLGGGRGAGRVLADHSRGEAGKSVVAEFERLEPGRDGWRSHCGVIPHDGALDGEGCEGGCRGVAAGAGRRPYG